jgi:hypothetical protein
MALSSCTEDLQNNAPLEIQALAQAKTDKTTSLGQKSGGYSGPCHCYIKFYAPDNLPLQQSWFLDDVSTTLTCVVGSNGRDISTGAFASSYSLTFSRATADQIILGTPVIGEFNHYFDCNGGGASGS